MSKALLYVILANGVNWYYAHVQVDLDNWPESFENGIALAGVTIEEQVDPVGRLIREIEGDADGV